MLKPDPNPVHQQLAKLRRELKVEIVKLRKEIKKTGSTRKVTQIKRRPARRTMRRPMRRAA